MYNGTFNGLDNGNFLTNNTGLENDFASYCGEAKLLFSYMEVQPNRERKNLINNLIKNLKRFGIWDNLEAFYIMASHNAQAGLINWINPSTYLMTAVGGMNFESDKGYTAASGKYLKTGIIPSTLTKYSLTNALHLLYINTNVSEANGDIDTRNSLTQRVFILSNSSGVCSQSLHASTNSGSNSNSIGCYTLKRTPSTGAILRKNSSNIAAGGTLDAVPTTELLIGARTGGANPTTKRYASYGIGLGTIDDMNFTNLVTKFLTDIGAN